MKNLVIFSFVVLGLASCKKDRVCTCNYQDGSLYYQTNYTNITKKDAKALCTTTAQGITCTVK
jgi:hypothetical protein